MQETPAWSTWRGLLGGDIRRIARNAATGVKFAEEVAKYAEEAAKYAERVVADIKTPTPTVPKDNFRFHPPTVKGPTPKKP